MPSLLHRVTAVLVTSLLVTSLTACGGSSSETPPPVEPTAHELSPSGPVVNTTVGTEPPSPKGRHHGGGDAGLF
jgi:hypothetical protein